MQACQVRDRRRLSPVSGPRCLGAAMAGEPRRGPSAQSSLRGPHRLLAWAWEVVVQALAASPGHAEADGLARKRTVSPGGRSPVSQARPRPGAWRPARRKGSQEGHAAEACSALCGRVPLGWGFPDLGGGVWEHAQSCQATLPCPPAPAILLKACAGQGPVHAATGACWSTSTSPPSLRPSPPPLGPQAVAYPRSLAVQCSAGCLSHSPQWGLLRILLRGTGL